MPYQVQQIIEGKGTPVCVTNDEGVSKALTLMIEYDFSQLPVIRKEGTFDIPLGMITYEGILRGIRNFGAGIADLMVGDVMVSAPIYTVEDDLFDILDRLKDTNAVLVRDFHGPDLVGIVTSYDAAEYFRNRTEDLMRVEDIELMVKEFIKAAYTDGGGELDEANLNDAIAKVTGNVNRGPTEADRRKTFDDLSLGDYNALVLLKDTWHLLEPCFGIQRDFVRELLNGIREIRNALAHFRGEISAEQRDKLKFGAEWLSRRQEEYQAKLDQERNCQMPEVLEKQAVQLVPAAVREDPGGYDVDYADQPGSIDYSVTESATSGGRLAALADWLQSQPGRVDQVPLTFSQIEEITKSDLPASAHRHRAWWANDSTVHAHSQQWLAAGWRTTSVNQSKGLVTFSRIREREQAYIAFFSKLLDDLRKTNKLPARQISPDGASWIEIQPIPRHGGQFGVFGFSFTRDKRMRVELYLDLGDQDQTKAAFDSLFAQKDHLEAQVGAIEWERLDNRRASRLAQYHDGQITEEANHPELRRWAVDTMVKLYGALVEPAEKAILEARHG